MTQITKLKHDKYILYVWKAATIIYLTVNNKDFYFQEYSLYYMNLSAMRPSTRKQETYCNKK